MVSETDSEWGQKAIFPGFKNPKKDISREAADVCATLLRKNVNNKKFLCRLIVSLQFKTDKAPTTPKAHKTHKAKAKACIEALDKTLKTLKISRTHDKKNPKVPSKAIKTPKTLFTHAYKVIKCPTAVTSGVYEPSKARKSRKSHKLQKLQKALSKDDKPQTPQVSYVYQETNLPSAHTCCKAPYKVPYKAYRNYMSLVFSNGYSFKPVSKATYVNYRHRMVIICTRLRISQDVESNPGPATQGIQGRDCAPKAPLLVISYNVRGLNDSSKVRHLVNYLYKLNKGKNMDFIAGLQETYISNSNSLNYLWRGNLFVTPGNGNSCGCITFLSSHLNVIASTIVQDRAHVLVCQRTGETAASYVIANIYAPNPNSNAKVEFFEKIFETINELEDRYNCNNVIILGDFNLTFGQDEMKNRNYSSQERRVASVVKNLMDSNNLADLWEENKVFTWNRANTDCFSTIDRIMFSKAYLEVKATKVNWSLSSSDHGAIETYFSFKKEPKKFRTRIARIDPYLAKNPRWSTRIIEDFNEMLATMPPHWDPHVRLEFAKVCVRTVSEKIQAESKRADISEEEELNVELNDTIDALGKAATGQRREQLIEDVEELRARKAVLIEEKGKRLAEKLGTKWYNEGEKSTRYFLRILNRATPDDFKNICVDGTNVTDQCTISKEIVKFYKNLYESFERIEVTDDRDFFNKIESVTAEDEAEVVKPVTLEELRRTLHTCADSSPGPDGIPYSIIGLLWVSYGPLLLDAWRHSLAIGQLAPSHKLSYLKLIPKAGKDLTKLTNWRPITLSNCDHKLITKTYALRMSEKVASSIGGNQTAYLKTRLINDNIRAIDGTIQLTNLEERAKGILVALDAKKAFDSVDHNYIEQCLQAFGLGRFIPIFRTLYAGLETDIIINGVVTKGFSIRRGVKQGDALSCVIFILCMEPLLRNIEANEEIVAIESTTLNKALPKAYAYADDVNATIKESPEGLQALFKEYERLSRMSGLELNADKTELMLLGSHPAEKVYDIEYLGKLYKVPSSVKIKINGITFQRDRNLMRDENVGDVMNKIEQIFRKWSRRSLSTLGKILIVKCFGISQIIYLMQSLNLNVMHFKKLNSLLYKFIWNRNYLAAKAPERIKRDIVNTPIKQGGFGMLDIVALDESLKLKALGRLLHTRHPFLKMIKDFVALDQFFYPKINIDVDEVTANGLNLLAKDRSLLWLNRSLDSNRDLLHAIADIEVDKLVGNRGKASVPFYLLWARGVRKVSDLTLPDLRSLQRYIDPSKINKLELAIVTRSGNAPLNFLETIQIKNKSKPLNLSSTKEIRESRTNKQVIREFKIGLNLSEMEARSWGLKLSKLSSTRHKNLLLRVAHGEIYTKEKLNRYGLSDSPLCPRCQMVETLRHKFIECPYVDRIWKIALRYTNKLTTENLSLERLDKVILGFHLNSNRTILTIYAEILQRIMSLKDDLDYVLHPKLIVKQALMFLVKRERNNSVKDELISILDETDG